VRLYCAEYHANGPAGMTDTTKNAPLQDPPWICSRDQPQVGARLAKQRLAISGFPAGPSWERQRGGRTEQDERADCPRTATPGEQPPLCISTSPPIASLLSSLNHPYVPELQDADTMKTAGRPRGTARCSRTGAADSLHARSEIRRPWGGKGGGRGRWEAQERNTMVLQTNDARPAIMGALCRGP